MPRAPAAKKKKLHLALSVDFDAISGWLGTGAHPHNNTADYSQGYFAGHVGVPRLLKVLRRLGVQDKVTWCLPGHSIETFPAQTRAVVASGAEIALHGYAHEGSAQMTAAQEEEVLLRCIELVEGLTGARPTGYRAPLYQLQERTIRLLQREGFSWDSSLTHYDATPYFLPKDPVPVRPIEFKEGVSAKEWMKPSPRFEELEKSSLVEVPCNWYQEDATPLQFYPNIPNSQGYTDVRLIERMWQDRFNWLLSELEDEDDDGALKVFSIVLHPDTSGMAHIIGMIERFLKWVLAHGDDVVEFRTCGSIAEQWRSMQQEKGKA